MILFTALYAQSANTSVSDFGFPLNVAKDSWTNLPLETSLFPALKSSVATLRLTCLVKWLFLLTIITQLPAAPQIQLIMLTFYLYYNDIIHVVQPNNMSEFNVIDCLAKGLRRAYRDRTLLVRVKRYSYSYIGRRSQAITKRFFPWERTFPGREDSFIHYQWISKSEVGPDNGLTRNTWGRCRIEKGPQIFTGGQGFLPFPLP